MTLLKLILITSLFCNGLCAATENGMILERFREYVGLTFHKYISFPIIGCIYCMSSLYSILAVGLYFILYGFELNVLYLLPVMICCVCALNGVIYNLLNDENV